jgi:sugar lactone lactonase YvrE
MPDVPIMPARLCTDPGAHLTLGEGPIWDPVRGTLLWVDIARGIVLEGDLVGGRVRTRSSRTYDVTVGAVTTTRDGGLLVAGARRVLLVDSQGEVTGTVPVIDPSVGSRLNDGGCDPAGRFLVGTLALDGRRGTERLYSIGADARPVLLLADLSLSNGVGFSPDGTRLYLVDSVPGVVHAFEYDTTTGALGRRDTVWTSTGLVPDGLTIDTLGNIWVAFFGAGQVHCLSPEGDLLARVVVPAPNTTCPAFVGPDLAQLLVATAREQITSEQLEQWPDSGGLFLADVGVHGLPAGAWSGSTVRDTVLASRPSTSEETPP